MKYLLAWIVNILSSFIFNVFPEEIYDIYIGRSDLGLAEKSFVHDGMTRIYLEYAPKTLKENSSMILLLQGTGGNPGLLFTAGVPTYEHLLPIAEERGILLLAPFADQLKLFGFDVPIVGGAWNDYGKSWLQTGADDVGFLESLVQFNIQEYKLDPDRVFVSGISGGGTMTLRLLNECSELFAAAAPMLAQLQKREDMSVPSDFVPTPMLALFGSKDPLIQFEGGDNGLLNDVRSARDTMEYFARLNNKGDMGDMKDPTRIELDMNSGDDCSAETVKYGPDTAPVEGYIIHGGGHNVPGTDLYIFIEPIVPLLFGNICDDEFDFSNVMVEFFDRFGL